MFQDKSVEQQASQFLRNNKATTNVELLEVEESNTTAIEGTITLYEIEYPNNATYVSMLLRYLPFYEPIITGMRFYDNQNVIQGDYQWSESFLPEFDRWDP